MNNTIVFLCSGGGGNLKFIYHAIQRNWLTGWSKIVVIADRECPAVDFARKNQIDSYIVNFSISDQKELRDIVASVSPDLIVTTVHRILCENFVTSFNGRMLNLHYSLLPAFSGSIGVKPVTDALNYSVRLIGVTVHKVTEVVDAGQPEVQVALPVDRGDTVEGAMDLSFRAGCYALLTAIKIIDQPNMLLQVGGYVEIKNRPALINPFIEYPICLNEDAFWNLLKIEG